MKKQNKGVLNGCYIGFLALCAVLMVVAAFQDLGLDQRLNNPQNAFGVFFERIGELPVYSILPFSAMVFFRTRKQGKDVLSVLKTAGIILFSLAGSIYMSISFGEYWFIKDDNRMLFCILFGVILSALTLGIAGYLPLEAMKKLRPYACFAMIAGIGTTLSIELMKNIWGRVRFRELLRAESFDGFTAWWQPQFFTGSKSFPSGHTGGASAALLLTALPSVFAGLKKYEVRIFILCALYTFAVGVSRMIVGAHYLSDIVVGALVGFAWYYCVRRFFLEKRLQKMM